MGREGGKEDSTYFLFSSFMVCALVCSDCDGQDERSECAVGLFSVTAGTKCREQVVCHEQLSHRIA